jgi:hypothetical protein
MPLSIGANTYTQVLRAELYLVIRIGVTVWCTGGVPQRARRAEFLFARSRVSGINFNYVVVKHEAGVEMRIGRGPNRAAENKEIFKILRSKNDGNRA